MKRIGMSGRIDKKLPKIAMILLLPLNTFASDAGSGQHADATPAKPSITDSSGAPDAGYHFSMAQAYSVEGKTAQAIEEYRLALTYDSQSPVLWTKLATEQVKAGQLEEALHSAKKSVELDAKNFDGRFILAGLLSAAKENAAALKQYETLRKLHPASEEALVYHAQHLGEMGKSGDGVRELKAFLKKNPEAVGAWFSLGKFQQQLNNHKEAVLSFDRVLELRPRLDQASLSRAISLEAVGRGKEALETYRKLFQEQQNLAAGMRWAQALLKDDKYAEAYPVLREAAEADAEDLNLQARVALLELELKKYDESIARFKAILVKQPDSDRVQFYLANAYEGAGKSEDAIKTLELISNQSQLFEDAKIHQAYLLRKAGAAPAAKEVLDRAIAQSARVPTFFLYRASLQEESGDVDAAISGLEKGVGFFPEHEKMRFYLGSLYDRKGDLQKSLSQMEAIVAKNPKHVEALNYLGYTWTLQGIRLNDAEKMIRQAILLKPESGYVRDTLGWYLFTRGQTKEAVMELEKAAKLTPKEATILDHLGDAYVRHNLKHKAIQIYQEALLNAHDEILKQKVSDKLQTLESGTVSRAPASIPEPSH